MTCGDALSTARALSGDKVSQWPFDNSSMYLTVLSGNYHVVLQSDKARCARGPGAVSVVNTARTALHSGVSRGFQNRERAVTKVNG
jgi:hypothetical protein